eukprot:Selendium_serpulae@DN6323_c0_g2_i1.p1
MRFVVQPTADASRISVTVDVAPAAQRPTNNTTTNATPNELENPNRRTKAEPDAATPEREPPPCAWSVDCHLAAVRSGATVQLVAHQRACACRPTADFHFVDSTHRHYLFVWPHGTVECSLAAAPAPPVVHDAARDDAVVCCVRAPRSPVLQHAVGAVNTLSLRRWGIRPELFMPLYIDRATPLGPWLAETPYDYGWTVSKDLRDESPAARAAFVERLLRAGLFFLPADDSDAVWILPNPRGRFVIDLAAAPAWHVLPRRYRKLKERLRLSVNTCFAHALERTAVCKEHSWITSDVTDIMKQFIRSRSTDDAPERRGVGCAEEVEALCFELWCCETRSLVGAVFSYRFGRVCSDYTQGTFCKDNRSLGSLLTRIVGDLFRRCGVDLWYWGIEAPYMSEQYTTSLGGKVMKARSFFEQWYDLSKPSSAVSISDSATNRDTHISERPYRDIVSLVRSNEYLIKHLDFEPDMGSVCNV